MKERTQQRQFKQLAIEEREAIQELLRDGCSLREIGRRLGREHTSISRELKKNRTALKGRYTPRLAQDKATEMRVNRGHRPRLKHAAIRQYAEAKLKLKWSPEQIAGRLPQDYPGYQVSHEAIYQYVYSRVHKEGWGIKVEGEDLRPCLRRSHKRRRRKYLSCSADQGRIRQQISIEKRPKYIEKRRQLGHWESYSMVSSQSNTGLNSLVERSTGFLKLKKVADGGSAATAAAIQQQLLPLPACLRRTVTSDNGKEHADHQQVSSVLNLKWYFCHAYASHERGTNENTNGLVRDYFPKKTDFALVPNQCIQEVEDLLNDRPRKRLRYKTPREVFNQRGALTC